MYKKFERAGKRYRTYHIRRVKKVRRAAKHPFVIPVITLLVLGTVTAVMAFIFLRSDTTTSPNVVVISDDRQQQIVSSNESTVGALLKKLKLDLHEGDVVEPALATRIQQDDFRINIYRAVPVEVIDGGSKVFARSAQTTSRNVAQQAGLEVFPEDRLEKKPITDFLATGGISEVVTIDRALPVNVNLYGAQVVMRSHAETVRALLEERKVKLGPKDEVRPALDTPLATAGQVSVVRNGLTTLTVQEDIPVPKQIIADNTLSYGVSAVRQKGAPGKRAVTYEVNTQNGAEVSRTAIQTVIIQQPVTEIVVQGSNLSGIKGDMARAGIAPSDYQYADHIISRESGWCPTKWQGEYGGCPVYHGTPTDPRIGYGLCQATPGSKMADSSRGGGPDWGTNPVTQLRWCSFYATSRYGSWAAAYNFWLSHHYW